MYHGADYFIVKFNKEENMSKTLSNGPWFINDFHLSVQKWEPQFVASEAKQLKSAVQVRLPQFLTEFYDSIILQKIGNTISKLLRIDACTSSTLRGCCARLCVEVSMEVPVKHVFTLVIINNKSTMKGIIYYARTMVS